MPIFRQSRFGLIRRLRNLECFPSLASEANPLLQVDLLRLLQTLFETLRSTNPSRNCPRGYPFLAPCTFSSHGQGCSLLLPFHSILCWMTILDGGQQAKARQSHLNSRNSNCCRVYTIIMNAVLHEFVTPNPSYIHVSKRPISGLKVLEEWPNADRLPTLKRLRRWPNL